MKRILLFCFVLLSIAEAQAQQRTVTGKVVDGEQGSSLPGVSVLVKGTSRGTVTDADGNYSIEASDDETLVYSFIGFESEERMVGSQSSIDISMRAAVSQLDEVVVIGYGERERKDVTGAISTVNSEEIVKSTAMTPELAMQGRLAGVFVSTPSGSPFARPTVRIRGVSTFGYAEPLYVIDGVPVIEGGASSGFAGDQDIRSPINIMTTINPNDIESISVLKDASAAAIYGVRASNGVILITTKRGKSGAPRIEFNASKGVQEVAKKYDILDTPGYVALWQEAYANNPTEVDNLPSVFDPADASYLGDRSRVNWQDDLINDNASIEDYGLSVSGGNEASTYFLSTGFGRTEGSLIENYLERYSLSSNVTSKISKVIETGLNLKLAYNKALDNTGADLNYVATAPPWQSIYDDSDVTGYAPSVDATFTPNPDFDLSSINPGPKFNIASSEYFWGPGTRGNVFASQSLNDNTFELFRTIGSVYLQVEPLRGLKLRGTLSGDYYFNLRKSWGNYDTWRFSQTPGNPYSGHDGTAKGSYGERQSRNFNLIKEFSINYNKTFGDHGIDILLNAMDQEQTWRYTDASSGQINSVDPDLRNVSNNPPFNGTFTGTREQRLQGYLARVSYKFRDKYYVDGTIRRDGSSVFAPDYRWGTFPSFALAWRISSEPFFQNLGADFINDLKIRGGWGELGNKETTQGFAYLSGINTTPDYAIGSGLGDPYGRQVLGARLPNYPNQELSWERVQTTNIGFDAVLFSNVSFTAEYYHRFTKGIIQSVSLPPNTGIEFPTDLNIATVKNTGIELQLGYTQQFGDFTFNASGNFTTVHNEVVDLYEGTPLDIDPDTPAGRVEEGYPIGYIFGYKVDGVFQNQQEVDDWKDVYTDNVGTNNQQPGDMYFQDLRGNPDPGEIYNEVRDSVINNNDQTFLGSTIPGFFYGLNVGGSYKGFDFSIFFQGIGDVKKYNGQRAFGEGMSAQTTPNQWRSVENRWTDENPSTTFPRAVVNDPNSNARTSDRFVESAAFMRIKNVQIGYTFPSTMLPKSGVINRIRIYVSGTNLATFTKWKGIDPENDLFPPLRQYMLGINAQF